MPRDNVEDLVQRVAQAWRERDVDGWVACFDPEVELLWPRNALEGGELQRSCGHTPGVR